jgi:hypothetical protein
MYTFANYQFQLELKQGWLRPVSRIAQAGYILLKVFKRLARFVNERRIGVPYGHTREYWLNN